MVEIIGLLWDGHSIAHIARHQVTPVEVEKVVFGEEEVQASSASIHDVSELRRLDVLRSERESSWAVRFDAADRARLRERAAAEGAGVTQPVRRWVKDRLDEQAPDSALDDLWKRWRAGCELQGHQARAQPEGGSRDDPIPTSAMFGGSS